MGGGRGDDSDLFADDFVDVFFLMVDLEEVEPLAFGVLSRGVGVFVIGVFAKVSCFVFGQVWVRSVGMFVSFFISY